MTDLCEEEKAVLLAAAAHRTTQETCELIAPYVMRYLKGEPFEGHVTTADLLSWMMPDTHDVPRYKGERQRLYKALLRLAKGELRNWRKHVDEGRHYMGRPAMTNVWFDAALNPYPTAGIDPSARASSRPIAKVEGPTQYEAELVEAFEGGDTHRVVSVVLDVAIRALADIAPEAAISFTQFGRHLLPDGHPYSTRMFNILRELSHAELSECITLRRGFAGGKETDLRFWHRAKNTSPALTE